MKTLAKYHICNHCVIGEKTFKNILIGPIKLPADFRETAPWAVNRTNTVFAIFYFNLSPKKPNRWNANSKQIFREQSL